MNIQQQQQLDNPGQFIRQWRKFSQGLVGKPSPYQDPVFHFEGQAWHGLPLYFGRRIRGYLQVGDEVLCFGHIADTFPSDTLRWEDARKLDPEEWLNTLCTYRRDWRTGLPVGPAVIHSLRFGSSCSARLDRAGWNISQFCLALPIELHYERRQILQDQGRWTEWEDRPDWPVKATSGTLPYASASYRLALNGPGGEDG